MNCSFNGYGLHRRHTAQIRDCCTQLRWRFGSCYAVWAQAEDGLACTNMHWELTGPLISRFRPIKHERKPASTPAIHSALLDRHTTNIVADTGPHQRLFENQHDDFKVCSAQNRLNVHEISQDWRESHGISHVDLGYGSLENNATTPGQERESPGSVGIWL